MSEHRVERLVRTDFPAIAPATPIRRAAALLVEARVALAPVIGEDGSLAGVLSQKDCFAPAVQASYYREWQGRVEEYMSREVVTVDPQQELLSVARQFLYHPHRVFPVCDGGVVLGLVHRSDVLARLLALG